MKYLQQGLTDKFKCRYSINSLNKTECVFKWIYLLEERPLNTNCV